MLVSVGSRIVSLCGGVVGVVVEDFVVLKSHVIYMCWIYVCVV